MEHQKVNDIVTSFKEVIEIEVAAVQQIISVDNAEILRACELLMNCTGRVICTGMGKSGHIARKIAATLSSTGTPAYFVHPGEASHGDLGMIQPGDVLLALSNSGETKELADLLTYAARRSIPMIAITKRADSALARHAVCIFLLPNMPEACSIRMAPTTSTTCSLVIGDALAVAVMRARGFQREDFLGFHPGGKLGAQLLTVEQLMHKGAELPVLPPSASMEEAILEMTSKGFGIAAIVDDKNRLVAVVSDGDLRRNIRNILDKSVSEIVNYAPKSVAPGALASEALGLMNSLRVNALCVVGENMELVGLLHLHDCLRAEVA